MVEKRACRLERGIAAGDDLETTAGARAAGNRQRAAEEPAAHVVQREARFAEGELARCLLDRRQPGKHTQLVRGELVVAGDPGGGELGERKVELHVKLAASCGLHSRGKA